MQATIAKEHPHEDEPRKAYRGSVGDVAAGGGKSVVPSAALNQAIADAGFFMQVALAAITPVAILDKRYPR